MGVEVLETAEAEVPGIAGALAEVPGIAEAEVPETVGALAEVPGIAEAEVPETVGALAEVPGIAEAEVPGIAGALAEVLAEVLERLPVVGWAARELRARLAAQVVARRGLPGPLSVARAAARVLGLLMEQLATALGLFEGSGVSLAQVLIWVLAASRVAAALAVWRATAAVGGAAQVGAVPPAAP